jgi:hypothetical protein
MSMDIAVQSPARHGRFYIWMAGICVLIAFGLFAPTYWMQLPARSFTGSPLLHLHGLLFSAWALFFFAQTIFAATDRIEHHKAWGLFGISLATAMVFSGCATGIGAMVGGIAAGYEQNARAFAIVPISAMLVFAVLIAFAIATIRSPETHKRLMLLATISIIQAPLDRIFFLMNAGMAPGLRPGILPPPPAEAAVPSGIIVISLIAIAVIHDWLTRGRPHSAYIAGGAFVIATIFLRAPMSDTPAWSMTTEFLAAFAR